MLRSGRGGGEPGVRLDGETPVTPSSRRLAAGKILPTLRLARMMYLSFLRWSGDKGKCRLLKIRKPPRDSAAFSAAPPPIALDRISAAPLAATCWNSFSPDGSPTPLPLTPRV